MLTWKCSAKRFQHAQYFWVIVVAKLCNIMHPKKLLTKMFDPVKTRDSSNQKSCSYIIHHVVLKVVTLLNEQNIRHQC